MRLDDDHRLSLSQERSDLYWGSDLTYTELDAERLDERPSRLLPSSGTAARRTPLRPEGDQ
jgi:hypothetical protein